MHANTSPESQQKGSALCVLEDSICQACATIDMLADKVSMFTEAQAETGSKLDLIGSGTLILAGKVSDDLIAALEAVSHEIWEYAKAARSLPESISKPISKS